MIPLGGLVSYLRTFLRLDQINDYPNAYNGLQVENSGSVTRIGAAVDACEASIQQAAEKGVNFLLVHHGLFWAGVQRIERAMYRKLKSAFENDMAIYSAHLPLDVHPIVGNNALLCRALGFEKMEPFFHQNDQAIGWKVSSALGRDELASKLEEVLGSRILICPGGPKRTRAIGIVTGGAGDGIATAAREGVDTFITGEGPHWSYTAAEELGINVLYGGHYATETFGVKALAAHLAERFALPWEFIDHPTGL
jgi:dinuclear metal center YbgI/SA1388 family protein